MNLETVISGCEFLSTLYLLPRTPLMIFVYYKEKLIGLGINNQFPHSSQTGTTIDWVVVVWSITKTLQFPMVSSKCYELRLHFISSNGKKCLNRIVYLFEDSYVPDI